MITKFDDFNRMNEGLKDLAVGIGLAASTMLGTSCSKTADVEPTSTHIKTSPDLRENLSGSAWQVESSTYLERDSNGTIVNSTPRKNTNDIVLYLYPDGTAYKLYAYGYGQPGQPNTKWSVSGDVITVDGKSFRVTSQRQNHAVQVWETEYNERLGTGAQPTTVKETWLIKKIQDNVTRP